MTIFHPPSAFDSDDLDGYDVVGNTDDYGQLTPLQRQRVRELAKRPVKRFTREERRAPERIGDLPRVALPFPIVCAPPAAIIEVEFVPQRTIGGPYWLGIRDAGNFCVRSLRFGQNEALYGFGDCPAEFFQINPTSPWPEGLVPINAPALHVGNLIRVSVMNRTCCTLELAMMLWGVPVPDDLCGWGHEKDYSGWREPTCNRQALERMTGEELAAGFCPACRHAECGHRDAERLRRQLAGQQVIVSSANDRAEQAAADARAAREASERHLAETLERAAVAAAANAPERVAARLRAEQAHSRCEADRAATAAYVNRGPDVDDSADGSWETPSWDD